MPGSNENTLMYRQLACDFINFITMTVLEKKSMVSFLDSSDKNAGWPKKSLALLQPLAFYLMGHFIFDVSQKTRTRVP